MVDIIGPLKDIHDSRFLNIACLDIRICSKGFSYIQSS